MKDHPRSPRRLVAWLALALLTLASNSVVRTTSICLIFTIFAPSAGLADVFVFSQTGSTVPGLRSRARSTSPAVVVWRTCLP